MDSLNFITGNKLMLTILLLGNTSAIFASTCKNIYAFSIFMLRLREKHTENSKCTFNFFKHNSRK